MKHLIIAKYHDTVSDKEEMFRRISELFSTWTEYPFIRGCQIIRNCIDRPNRYDVIIAVDLAPEDLPLWDGCELHRQWKAAFVEALQAKAIFDAEI